MKNILKRILCAAIAVSSVVSLLALSSCSSDTFNYLGKDLSSYISFDRSDYYGLNVQIELDRVTDEDVDFEILRTLAANKTTAKNNGAKTYNAVIGPGDIVYINYVGYYLDENGERVYFDGGCNFGSDPDDLEIGAEEGSGFILGFESNLIGHNPQETTDKFSVYTSGTVLENDIIYITYTDSDGNKHTNRRVDLSSDDLDADFGVGFRDFIIGQTVGEELEAKVFDNPGGFDYLYTSWEVSMRTEGEENLITVTTYFPVNYSSDELRGKVAYFDVYIKNIIDYNAPDLTAEFIKDTLKFETDKTNDDEIIAAYRDHVRATLEDEFDTSYRDLADMALWDVLKSNFTVKKLPKSAVKAEYNSLRSELISYYNSTTNYSSLDDCAESLFGYDESKYESYTDYLDEAAEEVVTEKLILYSILKAENLYLSDEQMNSEIDGLVKEYAEYYSMSEERILSIYDREFFIESVYYSYVMNTMIDFTNVTVTGKSADVTR